MANEVSNFDPNLVPGSHFNPPGLKSVIKNRFQIDYDAKMGQRKFKVEEKKIKTKWPPKICEIRAI